MTSGLKTQYPWLMLASIYITQYIGVAFIASAAVAILRKQGIDLDKLALLNLAALPLLGKVFYAPLIDKYSPYFQGQYRGWLILAQASMTLLLLVTGFLDLQLEFAWIMTCLTLYVLCMSVQDVSVDGLSCKLFDEKSRKFASSVQFSGNLLGNIIGGGVILMLYPWLQWHGALWLLAALTAISLFQILLFSEPKRVIAQSENQPLLRHMAAFIKQHRRWFFIMAIYPIGSTCGFALLNPLLVDNGWALDDIGFATKIFGSLVGLLSAFLATPLIAKVGRTNALITVLVIQSIALLLIIPVSLGYTDKLMVYSAITVHFISFPALLVVTATIIMDKAADTYHKATFFTLQFSFASVLGFTYSAVSLALAKHLGYSLVVIAGTVLAFVIAILVWFLLKPAKDPLLTIQAT
ncbi:MFS transporter [Marinomonas sp.]|nr:MFS transporter [Marinomonas sp.]MDB4837195.1 MFS transporter [Marinomonas sp.]